MGELAVKNLHGSGAGKVTVVNRTLVKSGRTCREIRWSCEIDEELQCTLLEADVLISSTGAT